MTRTYKALRMGTFMVRVVPLGPEGEELPETVLEVEQEDLFNWNFGQQYTDFLILEILPTGWLWSLS